MLEDFQCGDQLALGEGRTAAFMGKRRQRAYDRLVAHDLAEAALRAPDGDRGFAIDAIARLDLVQRGGMLAEQALVAAHALRGDGTFRYCHTGRVNSGWLRSAAMTAGSGSTPANA